MAGMGSLLASKSISRTYQGVSSTSGPTVTVTPAGRNPLVTANRARQHRLMACALILLVGTLAAVLYHDRDFWFPDQAQTQEDAQQAASSTATSTGVPRKQTRAKIHGKEQIHAGVPVATDVSEDSGTTITTTRTVLPPLEVEVVAGDSHRKLRPGSNSVQVDLARGSAASRATPTTVPADPDPVPAAITSRAAEHVQVSSDASHLVTHSVTPDYPTLARQMRVQGSVILQAVIGRDGMIEDLQIVSGPPILAGAAREAVKQWHFKPHYLGAQPVETQAKITVNFTISTN